MDLYLYEWALPCENQVFFIIKGCVEGYCGFWLFYVVVLVNCDFLDFQNPVVWLIVDLEIGHFDIFVL